MVNDFQNKPVAVQSVQPVPVMYQSPGPTPPPMPPMYPSMQPAQQKQHVTTESLPSQTVSFPSHQHSFQPQNSEYITKEGVIPKHSTPISHFSAQSTPTVSLPSDQKTITIIIDTNKMIYLLLFIILAIIILKK